jgi:hypothetical protein
MKSNLVVPIYIDTNALLDLLASIEDGFSIVEKVTTRTITTAGSDKLISGEAGTEFGIPNVLNLLKIKLGGSLSSKKQRETGEEKEAERYHTYGSLLYRLRAFLNDEELIKRPYENSEVWETIEPSDFVEVHGVFRPNPLADSLERIDRLIGLFEIMSDFSPLPSGQSSGSQRKGSQGDKKQMRQFRQFLQGILTDIEKKNTRTFVIDATGPNQFSTVVLLFTDYLRDQTMAEIGYKEYRLLGKVVRKIEQDSQETIDLLRGTGLGGVGRETLEQLWNAFNQIEQMNLPQVKSEISGPALEVVPIAIFI